MNKGINLFRFSSCMKINDVTQVFKKENWSEKDNDHLVRILPNLKIFKRCSHKQMFSFSDDIFSKYKCGFRNMEILNMEK